MEAEGWKGRNWPEPEAVEVKGQAMRSFGKRLNQLMIFADVYQKLQFSKSV